MLWVQPELRVDAVKLKDWREKEGKTQQWVADEINRLAEQAGTAERVGQSSVDRWEKGTIPRQENMRRLVQITGSAVGFADFYGDDGERPKRKPRSVAVNAAAARKAAATARRQREARQ